MEKKKLFNVKDIVGTALLLAVMIVLQLLSMVIPTAVTINLSLIPITIAAILYGPLSGGFLGLVCGAIILMTPNTVNLFMSASPVATVFTCLLKTSIAGVLAGLVYKVFKEKHPLLGSILASIIVPLINTLIFVVMCNFFFLEALKLTNIWQVFAALIGINFLFELISNVIICPSLLQILKQSQKNTADID